MGIFQDETGAALPREDPVKTPTTEPRQVTADRSAAADPPKEPAEQVPVDELLQNGEQTVVGLSASGLILRFFFFLPIL